MIVHRFSVEYCRGVCQDLLEVSKLSSFSLFPEEFPYSFFILIWPCVCAFEKHRLSEGNRNIKALHQLLFMNTYAKHLNLNLILILHSNLHSNIQTHELYTMQAQNSITDATIYSGHL